MEPRYFSNNENTEKKKQRLDTSTNSEGTTVQAPGCMPACLPRPFMLHTPVYATPVAAIERCILDTIPQQHPFVTRPGANAAKLVNAHRWIGRSSGTYHATVSLIGRDFLGQNASTLQQQQEQQEQALNEVHTTCIYIPSCSPRHTHTSKHLLEEGQGYCEKQQQQLQQQDCQQQRDCQHRDCQQQDTPVLLDGQALLEQGASLLLVARGEHEVRLHLQRRGHQRVSLPVEGLSDLRTTKYVF